MAPGRYSEELLRAFAGGEHEAFLAAGGRPLRPRLARALELAVLRPGLRVVDLGCGRGEASAHAALRGAAVTAVDYSPDALAMTARSASVVLGDGERAGAGVRRVAASADSLPLPARYADRVLLLDVVEHLHAWQLSAALEEARRILRPGGFVVIHTLPNTWALALAYPVLRWLAPELPRRARSRYEREVHVNEQSPWRLHRALRAAGLDARVWVEEWSTRHAALATERRFPDGLRARGYPVLRRPALRRAAGWLMRTPARWWVGNDLFAVAWRPEDGPPPGAG